MSRTSQVVVVLAALALLAAGPASAAAFSSAERSLLEEMNRARAAHGVPALRLDWRLQRAARSHSSDMLRRQYFSHGSATSRLSAFGVRGAKGENLAWAVGTRAQARFVVRQWLASPSHRANLLRRGFRRVGVASLRGTFAGFAGARVITVDFAG